MDGKSLIKLFAAVVKQACIILFLYMTVLIHTQVLMLVSLWKAACSLYPILLVIIEI